MNRSGDKMDFTEILIGQNRHQCVGYEVGDFSLLAGLRLFAVRANISLQDVYRKKLNLEATVLMQMLDHLLRLSINIGVPNTYIIYGHLLQSCIKKKVQFRRVSVGL